MSDCWEHSDREAVEGSSSAVKKPLHRTDVRSPHGSPGAGFAPCNRRGGGPSTASRSPSPRTRGEEWVWSSGGGEAGALLGVGGEIGVDGGGAFAAFADRP